MKRHDPRNVQNMIRCDLVLSILAGKARLNPQPRASKITQTLILLFVHAKADGDGVTRTSRKEIADGIQHSRTSVYDGVTALRDVGTLDVTGWGEMLEVRVNLAGAPTDSSSTP